MKTCGTCGEHKELEEFANDKRRKSGKGSECKICVRRRVRQYEIDHPEWRKRQTALYKKRHAEKIAADKRARYDRLMADNPEHVRAIRRKWARTPAGKAQSKRSSMQHYYGREVAEWWSTLVDPKCEYCDRSGTEIDHIVPVSKGGTHEISNLVPACRSCNASKGAKDAYEFLERSA